MKFSLQYEITSHDLAIALAERAEEAGTTERGCRWIRVRRKREIRKIAEELLYKRGTPNRWPDPEADLDRGLYECARGVVNDLWPEGA